MLTNLWNKIFSKKEDHEEVTRNLEIPSTVSEADKNRLNEVADSVVVGKIVSIEAHPDEKVTRVRITKCDIGNGKIEQILCGGTNISEGAIVPIATVGTHLPIGIMIGEREIRGIISRGMICAKSELGMQDHDEEKGQIWLLPSSLEPKIGFPLGSVL